MTDLNLAFVCVGAGRGVRFGGNKLTQMLGPQTVFAAAIEALERAAPEALMIVVVEEARLDFWRNVLAPDFPHARFIVGGHRRQESVKAGVLYAAQAGAETVAIHDAARPLVDPRDVEAVINALGEAAGAILTARVADTVKKIDSDDMVIDTVSRKRLRFALTPQVFRTATLIEVWQRSDPHRLWTDESALLESVGIPVQTVLAHHPNPKITTEADLEIARAIVESRT
jgi:2-C-methyl-D-erythritol 4-phosphate cytidylyltransferase